MKQRNDETSTGEGFGVPPICVHHRFHIESQAQRHMQNLAKEGKSISQRQERTYAKVAVQTAPSMVENKEPVNVSSLEAFTSNTYNSYRCFSKGLRRPLPKKVGSGGVVAQIPVIPYQHPRSYGSVLNLEKSQPRKGLTHSPDGGQQYDSALHQSFRFQITSNQSCDPGNPQIVSQTGVAPFSSTHRGSPERQSRRSFQV